MSDQEFTSVVIDRLARIETGIDSMNQKLDRLTDADTEHQKKLSDHDTRIFLLESKSDRGKTTLTIVVGIVAVAAFALTILDRFYS